MVETSLIEETKERLKSAARVVVLTGAGISAESGVPTFRGSGGLWKNYRAEDLATTGALVVEVNPKDTAISDYVDIRFQKKAGLVMPLFI